ncbi:Processing alpha glucosidase I [Neodidymelliopsis sp. IMI 364377]|nr:Processing alpha glucosidase I [Neodidymelliopsis sp. IMI 364377]
MQLLGTLVALGLFASALSKTVDSSLYSNEAPLLWGPYRPSVYLGIRPRVPESLVAGLMWGKLNEQEKKLRHAVEQSDGMAMFGWTTYARAGGTQIIQDVGNQIDVTTEFIKKYEGQSAGNWALRIKGKPRNGAPADLKTSVVFYVAMEAMESCTDCQLEAFEQLGVGDDKTVEAVNIAIKHPRLGSAGIHIPTSVGEDGRHEDTVVHTINVTENKIWQAKSQSKDRTEAGTIDDVLRNTPGAGNMHFVQMVAHGSFEFDILYSSRTATRAMTLSEMVSSIQDTVVSYREAYSHVFTPKAPFNTDEHRGFGEKMLADMLGGIGYFQGTSKVDVSNNAIYAETTRNFWEKTQDAKKHATPETRGPYELFTHTPARSVFQKGFLWNEGFHLLPVLDWDVDLAMEVVRSWLSTMDKDGWIAREQVLGAEAENNTPDEFITQYPQIANPPTLFLAVAKFVDILQGKTKYYGHKATLLQVDAGKKFVTELYPLLKKHYEWWRKSQSGDVEAHSIPAANLNEGYRWRGRTPETNYPSGMDDYPRAEPPDATELHLDALCWVGLMSSTLEKLAFFLGTTHDAFTYQNHIRGVKTNLESVHWEGKQSVYCDTVVRNDKHTYVCHKGYLSLFPFMTGMIEATHPRLDETLRLLRDPNHLWTDHGIRSLSQESKKYGVGDNYWRSPIFVNINYLILVQLLSLSRTPGPQQQRCRDIYIDLRRNIVRTVFNSWKQTGYAWEQYDPVGGHGQRTQHFTGWTSLVVSIMAMPNLEQGEGVKEKVKEIYEEAKKQAVQNQGYSAGTVGFVMVLLVFVYVTRRRFAGTWRSWKREKSLGDRNV